MIAHNKQDSAAHGVLFSNYIVCGYTLDIEPQNESLIHIAATISTDVAGATTTFGRI